MSGGRWVPDGRGCEKFIRDGHGIGGVVHLTTGYHATLFLTEQPFVRFDTRREARAFVENGQ